MSINELNEYIKHYMEKDKTQSAIMLSAPWGTGKSYYIKNSLVPFLKEKCDKQCVIVSLYGLNDIKEISKNIFLECKLKKINTNSVGANTGKIVAKTVVKGVASFFGVNLDINEGDLDKLYSSIDLTNKLIILEDVERSKIGILEILGFVNNLVEQDEVKVLLVTNEKELLNYKESSTNDDTKKVTRQFDEKTLEYLKVKEKTVSDTIMFYSSTSDAIINIMNKYDNKYLNDIRDEGLASTIENEIMANNIINSRNLRSFIFACQKTIDMFEKIDFDVDKNFFKNVFLGNVAFSLKRKNNDNLIWANADSISADLGIYKYPLYKFSYDFICYQYLDKEAIRKANSDFINYNKFMNAKNELQKYLNVIYSYYISPEEEVISAVRFIEDKLKTTQDIPLEDYGKLANYLIAIKSDLKCDDLVDNCKKNMLDNITEINLETMDNIRFHAGIQLETTESIEELQIFKEELSKKAKLNNKNELKFDYSKESIEDFCDYIYKNRNSFISKRCFAEKIINERFVELLKKCNAYEISELRNAFHTVYSFSNIKDFFAGDRDSLVDLKKRIEEMVNSDNEYDKIQLKQINYFINYLNELIETLS